MADLAVGAVTNLLGLIHNEALLLGNVHGDVQFIKEEMESISSFLARLARTTAPAAATGEKEDEQVRTWMKQVRELAQDCSNCIDLYLHRGDPAFHRARAGFWRYLWWASWFAHSMVARHKTAVQLRELKERARDVSERRARYDVKVPEDAGAAAVGPAVAALSQAPFALAPVAQDDDDGGRRWRDLQPLFLEEYCAGKLSGWLTEFLQEGDHDRAARRPMPSIAIVAPDADNSGDMARQALRLAASVHFDQTVWINLPQVHSPHDLPLLTEEILCYILQNCEQQAKDEEVRKDHDTVSRAFTYRYNKIDQIKKKISQIDFQGKIEEIKNRIGGQQESKWSSKCDKLLVMLYQALKSLQTGPTLDTYTSLSREEMISDATWMLKYEIMEAVEPEPPVALHLIQYEDILHKVFPASSSCNAQEEATAGARAVLSEDIIKEITHIIRELLPPKPRLPEGNNSDKEEQAGATATATAAAEIEEAKQKLQEIKWSMLDQLLIKGIVDKFGDKFQDKKTLIVLQDDMDYISNWEETRNALGLLGCAHGSAVIVTTKNSRTNRANEFCCPTGEPIVCSLVGLYYDRVLELYYGGGGGSSYDYDPQILGAILDRCHPHEYAMKIFVGDLYANPNRNSDDLHKLLHELDAAAASSNKVAADMTMLSFSYSSLPREYKTCLLYLAIFPQGDKIRRSTVVGRWIVEGLITMEDWTAAVSHAERCFDALVHRWLVYPDNVSATGKVKSCVVGKLVHDFITNMAKKERILDARLSRTWAQHFSIFSDLRLRASDSIRKFVQNPHKYSSQLTLLKVLDLKGCKCFSDKKHYLKNICNNILLLKYLSLRGTDATHLPREINNLCELEILDIRGTKVPSAETRHVLLQKLRRLLAGPVDPSPSSLDMAMPWSTAHIPFRIDKMENMEVLSNVMASSDGNELKEIRNLCWLRKLGVVIQDKEAHLLKLLQVICDLKDRIQSLSITLWPAADDPSSSRSTTDGLGLKSNVCDRLEKQSKCLESLSINGKTARMKQLLPLLTKGAKRLTKVTLNGTSLEEENFKNLAKQMPDLLCFRLWHKAYASRTLTFSQHDFHRLRSFLVYDLHTTDTIVFEDGAAPKLEKIALSSTGVKCLHGAGAIPSLKELELKGNKHLVSLRKDEAEEAEAHDDVVCTGDTTQGLLSFKKEEFRQLERLLVNAQLSTNISFEDGAAPRLQKIVLALQNISSVCGVNSLAGLTELELMGNNKQILLPLLKQTADRIAKVTLLDTMLNQGDLQDLAKKPNMHCLVLLEGSYDENQLAFGEAEFPGLKLLTVKCSAITSISFASGAAPRLNKIIWSFKRMKSLSGISNLPKLKELEFNSDLVPDEVRRDIKAHMKQPAVTYDYKSMQQHGDQEKGGAQQEEEEEDDDDTRPFSFSCCPSNNCIRYH